MSVVTPATPASHSDQPAALLQVSSSWEPRTIQTQDASEGQDETFEYRARVGDNLTIECRLVVTSVDVSNIGQEWVDPNKSTITQTNMSARFAYLLLQ